MKNISLEIKEDYPYDLCECYKHYENIFRQFIFDEVINKYLFIIFKISKLTSLINIYRMARAIALQSKSLLYLE